MAGRVIAGTMEFGTSQDSADGCASYGDCPRSDGPPYVA